MSHDAMLQQKLKRILPPLRAVTAPDTRPAACRARRLCPPCRSRFLSVHRVLCISPQYTAVRGGITSREAGSIGGQMVKNVLTVRLTKTASFKRENRIVDGHKQTVRYIAGIAI